MHKYTYLFEILTLEENASGTMSEIVEIIQIELFRFTPLS